MEDFFLAAPEAKRWFCRTNELDYKSYLCVPNHFYLPDGLHPPVPASRHDPAILLVGYDFLAGRVQVEVKVEMKVGV